MRDLDLTINVKIKVNGGLESTKPNLQSTISILNLIKKVHKKCMGVYIHLRKFFIIKNFFKFVFQFIKMHFT